MFYTIYKTTNQINGKIYIGYHSTKDLNDSYLGSGKILNQAIEKNGPENFTKEILYVFPSREEALQKERELVNEAFVQRDDTYNMKIGGEGGWDHTWESNSRPEIVERRRQGQKKAIREGRMRTLTDEQRLMGSASKPFLGKKHTEESRKKISENNGARLDETIIEDRIKDYENTPKERGYVSKLANKWGVTHTQVRRFLKQNGLD
jgi:group I intron endonuclease